MGHTSKVFVTITPGPREDRLIRSTESLAEIKHTCVSLSEVDRSNKNLDEDNRILRASSRNVDAEIVLKPPDGVSVFRSCLS